MNLQSDAFSLSLMIIFFLTATYAMIPKPLSGNSRFIWSLGSKKYHPLCFHNNLALSGFNHKNI